MKHYTYEQQPKEEENGYTAPDINISKYDKFKWPNKYSQFFFKLI